MTPDDVREIFERVIVDWRELERRRHRLEAMRSPTVSPGIAHTAGGGTSDPTAEAGCALADEADELRRMEAAHRERLAEVDALIDGLRRGCGPVYGDILADIYVRGFDYRTVAHLNGISRATVYRYRDMAFDFIASVGLVRAKAGDFGILAGE